MEPERKIEKLLRAFAKKRRADAGNPLKLHPANRRILQDEVVRKVKATGEDNEGNLLLLLLALFRRPLVFVLCGVAAVFIGVAIFLPALNTSKRYVQKIAAADNLKEIGIATRQFAKNNNDVLPASLGEVTNRLVMKEDLIDPVTGKLFVYVGGGKKLDELQSNVVLAYSPADRKDGRTVLFADGRVQTVPGERFAELTNQKSTELALADQSVRARLVNMPASEPTTAVAPPPALQTADDFEKAKPNGSVSLDFVQAGATANLQYSFRNDAVSARTTPVLQSFQVQQNGHAISVVDRDGSVYHGSLQPTNAMALNEPPPAEAPATAAPPQSQTKVAQAAGNEQQTVQNYFFRVAGMNRTLKQNVVFSGNLLANNAAPQPTQTTNFIGGFSGMAGGGGGGGGGNQFQQAAANQSQQSLLSNSRIVGTAVIASTNQIEINAVPVQ